jgi:hypothetical protein
MCVWVRTRVRAIVKTTGAAGGGGGCVYAWTQRRRGERGREGGRGAVQSRRTGACSLLGVANAVRVDGKDRLGLGQARRVENLADARLAAALAKVQPEGGVAHTAYVCVRAGGSWGREGGGAGPRGGGVGHDVAADGLLGVSVEHGLRAVDLGHHLVGQDDRHTKLANHRPRPAATPPGVSIECRVRPAAPMAPPRRRGEGGSAGSGRGASGGRPARHGPSSRCGRGRWHCR